MLVGLLGLLALLLPLPSFVFIVEIWRKSQSRRVADPFSLRRGAAGLPRTFGLTLSFPHLISCRKLISNYVSPTWALTAEGDCAPLRFAWPLGSALFSLFSVRGAGAISSTWRSDGRLAPHPLGFGLGFDSTSLALR